MLMTSGQGVVVNALLALGFECTYDDFDLCRMRKVEAPYLLELDVTFQLVQEPAPPPPQAQPPIGLTPGLAWLSHQLSLVNCHFDPEAFTRDSNEAVFARQDTFRHPRSGKTMTARVTVRARSSRAA